MAQESARRGARAATAAVPGALLGAVFGAVATLRRGKPLHPAGRVGAGHVDVTDPSPDLGIPLLAEPGRHGCLLRWSRAMGLPGRLPDVEGLAVRLDDPVADLLLASTGTGPVGRHVLQPRRPGRHGPLTTLLPVATRAGPILFAATPGTDGSEPPLRYGLAVARGSSSWRRVGAISVRSWGPDRPIRFDQVRHVLPGTWQYPVVERVREPAYRQARRRAPVR